MKHGHLNFKLVGLSHNVIIVTSTGFSHFHSTICVLLIGTTSHSEHVDLLYRVQGGTLPQESQLHIHQLPSISIIL